MKAIKSVEVMKRIFISIACCVLLAGCGASEAGSSKGTVLDASMNTVMIVDAAGDTLTFSTVDADKSGLDGLLIGDTVEVSYEGEYMPGMPAVKLSSAE